MTTVPQSQLIDISSFTRGEQEISGKIALAQLSRLLEVCAVDQLKGMAEVVVHGSLEQGLRLLRGQVKASLPLVCQRCMQSFELPIVTKFKLAVVACEQEAEQLPADCEPLILPEGELRVAALVEDELLLAMPTVGLHPVEQCKVKKGSWHFGKVALEPEQKANPFAQLADLKKVNK